MSPIRLRILPVPRAVWLAMALAAFWFVARHGLTMPHADEWAWLPVIAGSAIFSAVIFLLFWDGKMQALPNKGLIGILINLAILIVVFGLGWPAF